jgi:serine/threonine protein phosphatase 1
MDKPIYAIGDIHGQLEKLTEVLSRIEKNGGADARIVFLGDLVDRGPDSAGVVELLMQGLKSGKDWTVVKGNHDRMFAYFMQEVPKADPILRSDLSWLHPRLGGRETLASYGVRASLQDAPEVIHSQARALVPEAHIAFLNNLPAYHQIGAFLFVHAGIRPGAALADQTEDDLCWIRDSFLNDPRPHPWLVVHGHTAVETVQHRGNRINLDTGAGYGNPISVAVFEDDGIWTLEPTGRKALLPGG